MSTSLMILISFLVGGGGASFIAARQGPNAESPRELPPVAGERTAEPMPPSADEQDLEPTPPVQADGEAASPMHPLLGTLETRYHTIRVHVGLRYTIEDAEGILLGALLSEEEMRAALPAVYADLKEMLAGTPLWAGCYQGSPWESSQQVQPTRRVNIHPRPSD